MVYSGDIQLCYNKDMARFATTAYFDFVRTRPDRVFIQDDWIQRAIDNPIYEQVQVDGRIRRWVAIDELSDYSKGF